MQSTKQWAQEVQETEKVAVKPEETDRAIDTVKYVIRHALQIVERYWQFKCNELFNKGLDVETHSKVYTTERGACLEIEVMPKKKSILDLALFYAYHRRLTKSDRKIKTKKMRDADFTAEVDDTIPYPEDVTVEMLDEKRRTCRDCGRVFDTVKGLKIHRSKKKGGKSGRT